MTRRTLLSSLAALCVPWKVWRSPCSLPTDYTMAVLPFPEADLIPGFDPERQQMLCSGLGSGLTWVSTGEPCDA